MIRDEILMNDMLRRRQDWEEILMLMTLAGRTSLEVVYPRDQRQKIEDIDTLFVNRRILV